MDTTYTSNTIKETMDTIYTVADACTGEGAWSCLGVDLVGSW